jgi:hypothetical protein
MSQGERRRKKQLRRQGRQKKKVSNRLSDPTSQRSIPMPPIRFTGKASPQFEEAVRQAASMLTAISPDDIAYFEKLLPACPSYLPAEMWVDNTLGMLIGWSVFRKLGSSFNETLLDNSIRFHATPSGVVGDFRSLKRMRLPDGFAGHIQRGEDDRWMIYAPDAPVVTIDGAPRSVGYSIHALKRIAERLITDHTTYEGHLHLFTCLSNEQFCVESRMTLTMEQSHVDMWKPCVRFFRRLLPDSRIDPLFGGLGHLVDDDGTGKYVSIGYGSLRLDGPIAVVTTFLPPGYKGTQEQVIQFDVTIPEHLRKAVETLREQTPYKYLHPANPQVIRAYHELFGFKQVFRGGDLWPASPS